MILYEDKEILVCHKPVGIPVQSASVREKDMVSILRNHLAGEVYVVHRLDQPVEGVLVFAKTKRAASNLSRQITDGSMKKVYHALVCEASSNAETAGWHTLVDYLVKDGRQNRSFVSDAADNRAKRAELRYRILGCREVTGTQKPHTLALAEIELKTGRHHQIRVQMAHAGLPLVGDRKYNSAWDAGADLSENPSRSGEPVWLEALKQTGNAASLALCAVSLTFRHPTSGKRMTFETQPRWEVR